MNTKNLNLVTYGLGDVTDWITGFSNNMNLIDNFAGSVDSKIKNVESSTDNLDQQVQNISNELTNFGEEMDTMNTNINSISTRVQQNTTLINAIPKMKKYINTFTNTQNLNMQWYQEAHRDFYQVNGYIEVIKTITFQLSNTFQVTFTDTDAPFMQSAVGRNSSTSTYQFLPDLGYINITLNIVSSNKIQVFINGGSEKTLQVGYKIPINFVIPMS